MNYKCPTCGSSIASWIVKEARFKCPGCETPLASNSKRTFKQSLVVAFASWVIFLLAMQQFTGSWAYAAVVSIEGGGIVAAILAALYYRLVVRIKAPVD